MSTVSNDDVVVVVVVCCCVATELMSTVSNDDVVVDKSRVYPCTAALLKATACLNDGVCLLDYNRLNPQCRLYSIHVITHCTVQVIQHLCYIV